MSGRPYLLSLFSILLTCSLRAAEPRDLLTRKADPETTAKYLLPAKDWVRYPEYTDRKGWDQLTGSLKAAIIKEGESQLTYNWKIITASQYLEYERSGSRTAMEDPAGANNRALSRLLMAELAEGKGRFTEQLINGVWAACDMSSWVASAHLPVQQSHRSLPDFNEQIIDLGSGDMGSFFAWTWYFMHSEFDKVDPVIAARLLKNIRERIMDPYLQRNDYWWQALDGKSGVLVNNWNPWCNFNVLTCFLLLENDPAKRAAAVYKTMRSTDQFINYVKADGACEEGPSYWGHAAGKLYDYLEILYRATGGRVSLFDEPMIKRMGEYIVRSYVGNDWVVNFADASAKGGGEPGLVYRYGKAVGSSDMQSFAAYLLKNRKGNMEINITRDFFRSIENIQSYSGLQTVQPALPASLISWYPQTEFCYIKTTGGLFFAAKAGFNNESHNHNDVGTFSLYVNETPVFIDAGVGTYTRQTFGPERYTIWTMQSEYHNLPLINGIAQVYGAAYKANNTVFDSVKHIFRTDIAKAYDKEAAVSSWIREYRVNDNDLVLTDRFRLENANGLNEEHFLTRTAPVQLKAGMLQLTVENSSVTLQYNPGQFSFSYEAIPQTDKRLSTVWGEKIYRLKFTALKKQVKGEYVFVIRKN